MKKMINTYRVFYPDVLSIFSLLGVPLILVGVTLLYLPFIGNIMIFVAASMLGIYELIFDCIVFAGICNREVPPRTLKCAFYGEKVLKDGLILDCIRRFVYDAAVLFLITGIVISKGYGTNQLFLLTGLCVISIYVVSTLAFNGLRYLENTMTYMFFATLISMGEIALCIWLYILYDAGKISYLIWIVMFVLASVALSVVTVWHMMKRYQCSFYGKEKKENE